ncbi:MAG: hypothetical protein GF417_08890 [Candidatus Latescibacteria bacterium]|nr:hypothetical protein [bacterium]MBD3424538.1 hypothetical protein [Candidatus Latescibacterota bacterium]
MDQGIEKQLSGGGQSSVPADYFFLLRPMILIPVWSFFLLGASSDSESIGPEAYSIKLIAGLISFTLMTGSFYIINQVTDRGSDLENDKLFLLPRGIISVRGAVVETIILILSSFIISALFMPLAFSIILLAGLILGAAYSIEPVRLKRRPFFDIAANAAGIGVLAPLAGGIAGGVGIPDLMKILPYPLAVASVHLVTTLADLEGDRRSGLRTSGAALGNNWSIIISVLLMLGALLAAFLAGNSTALYAVLLSLPFYLVLAGRDTESDSKVLLPAKAATIIFAVAAGVSFRLFLPFLAVLILVTRLYYSRRFGISYPSFR